MISECSESLVTGETSIGFDGPIVKSTIANPYFIAHALALVANRLDTTTLLLVEILPALCIPTNSTICPKQSSILGATRYSLVASLQMRRLPNERIVRIPIKLGNIQLLHLHLC